MEEGITVQLAALLEQGDDVEAARLIADSLEGMAGLADEDRLRIAAEVVAWL